MIRLDSTTRPSGCNNNVQLRRYSARRAILRSSAPALLVFVGVALASLPTARAAVTVERLRSEYLENPLGIDATEPRLSWNLASSQRGAQQRAYQVLVASSAGKLAANEGDLWDSGRVDADKSIQIRYAGKPLASREECYWKVRVWDQDDHASDWSKPAHWSMGLLKAADWHAKWIGLDGEVTPVPLRGTNWIWYPEGQADKEVPVGERYFRRTFVLPSDRKIKRVQYLATADNQCKAFINGRDIGGRDNYRTVKDSDLTHDLHPGKNLLAVVGMNKGQEPNPAGIVGILKIKFDHGPEQVILTDDQWKVSDTEAPGWNTDANFNDSDWKAARVTGPVGMEPWGDVRAPEDRRLPARYLRKEFRSDKQVRSRDGQLLRPRPVGALSQRQKGGRRGPLSRGHRISKTSPLRHARRHRSDQKGPERAGRNPRQRPLLFDAEQSLFGHAPLWLSEAAVESAHRIRRRQLPGGRQRRHLEAHGRRSDPREQRIRRRRIRRPQGIHSLDRARFQRPPLADGRARRRARGRRRRRDDRADSSRRHTRAAENHRAATGRLHFRHGPEHGRLVPAEGIGPGWHASHATPCRNA